MHNLITPSTLAELLGVSIHDLRNWRRLPTDHPRHIASTVKDCRHHFASPDIIDFLKRNADMAERVAGLFAPPVLALALKGCHPAANTPVEPSPPTAPINRSAIDWWLSHTESSHAEG